jgi:cyanophycinase-like exopeptidase
VSTQLVVMGSGETTPTMVSTHQRVLAESPADRPAVLLDTPYGFQENADELTARTRQYFARNVGRDVDVLSLRTATGLTPVREEDLLASLRDAAWVFAGPGSPTYLARQWTATGVPAALRDRLGRPGATVFASAAACTLGAVVIPVYEIYKAGEAPHWREGLDLLAPIGIDAVVIPHFDNSEGGTHDTRFCYLGERRLRVMEDLLAPSTWVLGVDEHTALLLDLTAGRVSVEGRGGVTVRTRDASTTFPAGTQVDLDTLLAAAEGRSGAVAPAAAAPPASPSVDAPSDASVDASAGAPADASSDASAAGAESPLMAAIGEAAAAFDAALADDRALDAAEATVGLEATIEAWSTDSLQSDELERARAEVRRQIVALARVAQAGLHRHRDLVAPHVEALLQLREQARAERRFEDADTIRDALTGAGVEVRDAAEGTDWSYLDPLDASR